MSVKTHKTRQVDSSVATVGRFYEKDGNRVGEPIKVQIVGDVFPPHVRILRKSDGVQACVRLDKAQYFPSRWHVQRLTDEQVDGLIEFFRSPSDFSAVRLDGTTYKLKTMWDYTIVAWNRECDDVCMRFALQRDSDGYLASQMPDYTKLNQSLSSAKITYDDIDTCELARVAKEDTGLMYDLMLDSLGKDRRDVPPHIFVCVGDELVPLPLSSNAEESGANDPNGFACVRKYVRAYMLVLLAHHNKLLTDRQALDLLGDIETADSELVNSTLRKVNATAKKYD